MQRRHKYSIKSKRIWEGNINISCIVKRVTVLEEFFVRVWQVVSKFRNYQHTKKQFVYKIRLLRLCICYRNTITKRFSIDGEITRQYKRFNTTGTQLTLRLSAPSDDDDPISHFLDSMSDLFEFALRNCNDSDMVGTTIHNEVNLEDKPIGISFRRKDQLSGDVVWRRCPSQMPDLTHWIKWPSLCIPLRCLWDLGVLKLKDAQCLLWLIWSVV
jgi:hypothetical protein